MFFANHLRAWWTFLQASLVVLSWGLRLYLDVVRTMWFAFFFDARLNSRQRGSNALGNLFAAAASKEIGRRSLAIELTL